MSTAELRSRLFGTDAPEFAESWVEGPTLRSNFITATLANRPYATGFSGLCAVDIGIANFRWKIGKQTEKAFLEDQPHLTIQRHFMIVDDRPMFTRSADSGTCATISALFRTNGGKPIPVWYQGEGTPVSDNAEAARFGFAALVGAQQAAGRLPVDAERCVRGDTDIPYSCNAPASFVRTRFLRDVRGLAVKRCETGSTLCVDATVARSTNCGMPWWAGPCGEDHIVVETDIQSLAGTDMFDQAKVRSIKVRAGTNPIP